MKERILTEKLGNKGLIYDLNYADIYVRSFRYVGIFIFAFFALVIFTTITEIDHTLFKFGKIIAWTLTAIPPFLIIVAIEANVRSRRRSLDLDIYENIEHDVEQMIVDERIAKENIANKNYKKSVGADEDVVSKPKNSGESGVNKDDLEYWFNLKEKRIITDAEFDKKKLELM